MAKVPNGVGILPKISIAWTLQTTDGRTTTYSEREREFTFAKYYTVSWKKGATLFFCRNFAKS